MRPEVPYVIEESRMQSIRGIHLLQREGTYEDLERLSSSIISYLSPWHHTTNFCWLRTPGISNFFISFSSPHNVLL